MLIMKIANFTAELQTKAFVWHIEAKNKIAVFLKRNFIEKELSNFLFKIRYCIYLCIVPFSYIISN